MPKKQHSNGKNGHSNGTGNGLTNGQQSAGNTAFDSSGGRAHTIELSISTRVQQMIEREFTPECIEEVLSGCLTAEKPCVIRIGKEAQFSMEPDYVTRLKTVELIWSYQMGRPIERQEILTSTVKQSFPEMMITLAGDFEKSPALADAAVPVLEKMLAEIKRKKAAKV